MLSQKEATPFILFEGLCSAALCLCEYALPLPQEMKQNPSSGLLERAWNAILAWKRCKEATLVQYSSLKLLFEDLNLEYFIFWLKNSMIHPGPEEASSGSDWGQKCGSGAVAEWLGCEMWPLQSLLSSSDGFLQPGWPLPWLHPCWRCHLCRNSLLEQRCLRVLVLGFVFFHSVS